MVMPTDSRKNTSPFEDLGPLLGGLIIVACILAALPAWIIGFVAQRCLERTSLHWKLRTLLWLALSLLAGYYLSSHSVVDLYSRELADYTLAATTYQSNLLHWPWKLLWAETWPVWLRLLWAAPFAGLAHELWSNGPAGQTARQLLQQQRRRQRAMDRAHERARKRAQSPGQIPDSVGGKMVIG